MLKFVVFVAVVLGLVGGAPITIPESEDAPGDPYAYAYSVQAEPNENSTRLQQAKGESSDGMDVVGMYKVLLPDGNLQTVTYTAGPDGYKANVHYARVEEPVGVTNSAVKSSRSRHVASSSDDDPDVNRVHPLNAGHHFQDDVESSEAARIQFRQRSNRIRADRPASGGSSSRGSFDSPRTRSSTSKSGSGNRRFDRNNRHARPESN